MKKRNLLLGAILCSIFLLGLNACSDDTSNDVVTEEPKPDNPDGNGDNNDGNGNGNDNDDGNNNDNDTSIHQFDPKTLIAEYDFNGDAIDSSGNNHHGTINGASLTTGRNNIANGAYSFDGKDDYIKLPKDLALNTSNNFSIEAWIKKSNYTSDARYNDDAIFGQSDGDAGSDFPKVGLVMNPNKTATGSIRGTDHPELKTTSKDAISDNKWHHIVMVRNVTNKSLTIYIDGKKSSEASTTLNGNSLSNDFVAIGAWYDDLKGWFHFFSGDIDLVRLWNTSLSATEINHLAKDTFEIKSGKHQISRSLLTAQYNFDGNANDSSGNNYHGTVNGAKKTIGRNNTVNGAYSFDGTNDYIKLPTNTALNTSHSFSIEAWIKKNKYTSDARYNDDAIFGQSDGDAGSDFPKVGLVMNPNKTATGSIRGTANPLLETTSKDAISDNKWHHIVMVRSVKNRSLSLYIDGKKSSEASIKLNGNSFSNDFVAIGAWYDDLKGWFHFFSGEMDLVRLWNTSLSETDINHLAKDTFEIK